jgi:hypothetical protein
MGIVAKPYSKTYWIANFIDAGLAGMVREKSASCFRPWSSW